MPTHVGTTTTNATDTGLPEGFHLLSNDLNDFVDSGIGPDQADVRIRFEYASFDYAGTRANDPVLAVKGTCTPLDGSNEGKDFDAHWTVGPKMSDVIIANNGGSVASKVKASFSPKSLWAIFLRSLGDIDPAVVKIPSGPGGVRELDGIEVTIKRQPQPKMEGLTDDNKDNKNEKGYTRSYYHCLKILALPGESGKAGRKPAARSAAPAKSNATAAAPTSNGSGSSTSKSVLDYIKAALDASPTGSVPLKGGGNLATLVFKLVKADGGSTQEANSTGSQAINEDFLIEQNMEHDLGWVVENGILSKG